jgi:diketogulonate reductase-like aldo/keto reductase
VFSSIGISRGPLVAARFASVRAVRVPTFIYGTAWKEDDTGRLVRMALDAGFRGIDTANQRRH